MTNFFKWLSGLAMIVSGVAGNMPGVVRILLVVMVLDVFTGICQAVIKKNLDSEIAYNGVAKKAVTLIIVSLSYVIASTIAGVDASAPIGQAVAGFYITVEIISILEKADNIGIPIPAFLRAALNNLKQADRRKTPELPGES